METEKNIYPKSIKQWFSQSTSASLKTTGSVRANRRNMPELLLNVEYVVSII